jgi:hypothetical protein
LHFTWSPAEYTILSGPPLDSLVSCPLKLHEAMPNFDQRLASDQMRVLVTFRNPHSEELKVDESEVVEVIEIEELHAQAILLEPGDWVVPSPPFRCWSIDSHWSVGRPQTNRQTRAWLTVNREVRIGDPERPNDQVHEERIADAAESIQRVKVHIASKLRSKECVP